MLLPKIFPVTCHTKHVGPGSLFVAINGFTSDGRTYIEQALAQGASKVFYEPDERHPARPNDVRYVTVTNARRTLAELSAATLNFPSQSLKIIGVTGTKGKTTTTYLIEHILHSAGYRTAMLSSVTNKCLDEHEESTLTTASSDYLQMFFARCQEKKIDYVVMEVSSHALSLERVYGITFAGVVITNLQQDHLDFYGTEENYHAAKLLLLDQLSSDSLAIINGNDPGSIKKLDAILKKITPQQLHISTSTDNASIKNPREKQPITHASYTATSSLRNGITITLDDSSTLSAPALLGMFNAANLHQAILLCKHLGLSSDDIAQAMQTFPGVPGRLTMHKLTSGAVACVDFAHNTSSIIATLSFLRTLTTHLIVVFGCGGDRDRTKRPLMGQAAITYADAVIITSDNPRHEDPATIINDIMTGIPDEALSRVMRIENRSTAIQQALILAKKDSLIAILGKGHEHYQIIGDSKIPFDDLEEIKSHEKTISCESLATIEKQPVVHASHAVYQKPF